MVKVFDTKKYIELYGEHDYQENLIWIRNVEGYIAKQDEVVPNLYHVKQYALDSKWLCNRKNGKEW